MNRLLNLLPNQKNTVIPDLFRPAGEAGRTPQSFVRNDAHKSRHREARSDLSATAKTLQKILSVL
jgi:hypothetical protein